MHLAGRTAVVTGGASGIGSALARAFAAAGASGVAIADRDRAGAQRVAQEIGSAALSVECDVSEGADLERLIARGFQLQVLLEVQVWLPVHATEILLPMLSQAERWPLSTQARTVPGLQQWNWQIPDAHTAPLPFEQLVPSEYKQLPVESQANAPEHVDSCLSPVSV